MSGDILALLKISGPAVTGLKGRNISAQGEALCLSTASKPLSPAGAAYQNQAFPLFFAKAVSFLSKMKIYPSKMEGFFISGKNQYTIPKRQNPIPIRVSLETSFTKKYRHDVWHHKGKTFKHMKDKPGTNILYYCLTGSFTAILLASIIYRIIIQSY